MLVGTWFAGCFDFGLGFFLEVCCVGFVCFGLCFVFIILVFVCVGVFVLWCCFVCVCAHCVGFVFALFFAFGCLFVDLNVPALV